MAFRRSSTRPGRPARLPRPRSRRPAGAACAPRAERGLAADAQRLLALLHTVVGATFKQIVWCRASRWELTFAQAQVLFHVERHPACRMQTVARAFAVTLPAVTQIVDRLEQKGFLARGAQPGDRRVATLRLTAGGAAVVGDLHRARAAAMEAVLARIPPRERPRVLEGLEALVRAATTGGEPAGRDVTGAATP